MVFPLLVTYVTFLPYLYFTGPEVSFTTKVEPGVYSSIVPDDVVVDVVVVTSAPMAETAMRLQSSGTSIFFIRTCLSKVHDIPVFRTRSDPWMKLVSGANLTSM